MGIVPRHAGRDATTNHGPGLRVLARDGVWGWKWEDAHGRRVWYRARSDIHQRQLDAVGNHWCGLESLLPHRGQGEHGILREVSRRGEWDHGQALGEEHV